MKTSRPTGLPMMAIVNPMAKISILFSVLFLGFCLTTVNAGSHHSKGVQVTVKAKWSGTSLLLEAGEFLVKENKDFFWQFLSAWMDLLGGGQKISSDQECLDVMLATAKVTLGEELLPLLHLSLALRRSSPKMILYNQLAEEALSRHQEEKLTACCWIDVGLQLLTGPEGLAEWLSQLEERSSESARGVDVHSFDHVHPASVEGKPVAVLYGALGTTCFGQLHTALAKAAEKGLVKYVFRPVLPQRCESDADRCTQLGTGGPINLGGYGVELALKNMEYKAIDDSKLQSSKKGNDDEAAGLEAEDLSQDVKGFIFSKLLERKPELTAELLTFRDNLLSTTHAMDKVAVWELKDLGFQAAQRIALASEPLRLMQEMSQNFPNLVSSLSRMKLNKTIKEEISGNQRMLMAGKSLIAINGALLNAESLELFSLLDTIQGELSLARMLSNLRLPKPSIRELLRVMPGEAKGEVRVDMRSDEYLHYLNNIEQDVQYKSWRTNLQELLMPVFPGQMRYVRKNLFNAHYALDPGSIDGMKEIETLMYYYTNGVPIRFGVVFVSSYVMSVLDHYGGDLPDDAFSDTSVNAEDMSGLVIQVFLWTKDNAGLKTAFDFLSHLSANELEAARTEIVRVEEIVEALTKALKGQAKKTKSAAEIVEEVHSSGEYFEQVVASTSFVYGRGLGHLVPCLLMNGDVNPLTGEASKKLMDVFNEEMGRVQEAIYYQSIRQKTDVLAFFLKESGVTRYNPQVLESSELHVYVPLSDATAAAQTGDTSPLASLQYLHHQGTEDDTKPITHWLVVDLTTTAGISLVRQALRYLSDPERTASRLAIFHNPLDLAPGSDVSQSQLLLPRIVLAATSLKTRRSKLVPFLQQLLASTIAEAGASADLMADQAAALVAAAIEEARNAGLNGLEFGVSLSSKSFIEKALTRIQEERSFVKKTFGIEPGVQAIVTNGRVLYPKTTSSFMAEDFALLERVQYERQVERIESIVNQIEWVDIDPDDLTSDFLSTVIMAVSSCVSARTRSGDSARFDMLQAQHGAIVHENNDAAVHIDAVIDPLSAVGQRLTPLLVLIQEWMQPSLRILLNPQTSLSDVPLKNFYRFAAPLTRDLSVDVLEEGSSAVFSNMPASRTLTINLFVPEAWLVEQVVAPMDLDNLILSKMEDTNVLNAVYELEAIVITGHCMEANREPPRGLQLLLGTEQEPHVVDTIVMANLGYFQLKAAPGLWTLSLAPGRSSQLFTMPGPGEGTEEGPLSMPVVLADLTGSIVRLEVKRRRGKEGYKILDTGDGEDMDSASEDENEAFNELEELSEEEVEEDEDVEEALPPQGLWEQLREKVLAGVRNLMGIAEQSSDDTPEPKQPPRKAPQSHTKVSEAGAEVKKESLEKGGGEEEDKTINIFSIASGLLYERFTRIMILSVLKNTQRPVKFWFIKNYLSPSFKDTIREMAQEYGFGVELVTYKWPAWLHKQTDKQRLIWAYKILFLDVLFPLSLKKVIFVDADQIVRADMAELYDMDLHGRPLAYTPFCDNNKDMDGFRFWKQGFWRDHLRGRPYHISALYVVDLVKFRQEAAGDHLRVFYESLSKDPNSLANLDQDLPNYAQHSVQIFSLPQEWLWCESWCGNATKSHAKTIDLCNNPLTKEPKLEGARRIVTEWPALDDEQRRFMERLQGLEGEDEAPAADAVPVAASVTDDTAEAHSSEAESNIAVTEAESNIAESQDSFRQEEDAQEQELEKDETDEVESEDESGRDPETAGEL